MIHCSPDHTVIAPKTTIRPVESHSIGEMRPSFTFEKISAAIAAMTNADVLWTTASSVPNARYCDLAGLRHEVFNETTRADVFAELTKTLAATA